ncbi:cell division cycle-associated protein 7-like [Plakobranchus ocellatus]|uniref:protein O-GlcNAcase n=1 Tax=Plakobranchus ocellatus TaxID=259542 RepID=A0AAV3YHF4_9GAST|nr:cell division cycle-associated protein 7-like [Plakobranchus ocellatus]
MTLENGTLITGRMKFISGVVEGFYGRPWSAEQRKLLFTWMQKCGLNTYMYAPKDDYKHRAYWRELYSVEEAENLTHLITAAKEKEVTFVYAISPGLDISFSNAKDVLALKRKLEQVSTFGCDAFAVLFDDIDPELSEADRSAFQSFGLAQVSVSNEVYEHLHEPKLFLFCPTEYCASRAIPTVSSSEYLNTIGSKLLPGIDIMWTGPRVVSKKLTIPSLEEISSVLKRPAVIWDNIHANDYDPRRIFLGPYEGRSPEIIPYINGVMTNPNTEFEANFIAIHTLGQWCQSNPDGVKKDIMKDDRMSPIASDIKLETENEFTIDDDLASRVDTRYQPKMALKTAVKDWLLELHCHREPPRQPFPRVIPTFLQGSSGPPGVPTDEPSGHTGPPVMQNPSPPIDDLPGLPTSLPGNPSIPPGVKPLATGEDVNVEDVPSAAQPCMDPSELQAPSTPPENYLPPSPPAGLPLPDVIKTCLTPAFTTQSSTVSSIPAISMICSSVRAPEPISTFLQPPSLPVSSLSEAPPSDSISDTGSTTESGAEPMDIAMPSTSDCPDSSQSSPMPLGTDGASSPQITPVLEKQHSSDSLMQVESDIPSDRKEYPEDNHSASQIKLEAVFSEDDALAIVNLFYMPFEHGNNSLFFLQRLHWLRNNALAISKKKGHAEHSFEATEWHHLSEEFIARVEQASNLLVKLVNGPNKSFMCDMYSYLWDLVSLLKICRAHVQWLAKGLATQPLAQQTFSCVTWFSKGYKEAFMSGDQEPWVFRGGLQAELQRLLPIDSAHDLFYIKPPDYIVTRPCNLRPYTPADEDALYNICLKTCDDGMDGTDVFPEHPLLMGDKIIGKFLTLSPEYGFVIEDDMGVCGYAVAALDARDFAKKSEISWLPAMCEKYGSPEKKEGYTPAEEVIQSFHGEQKIISDEVYSQFPSVLRLDVLPNRVEDPALPRRLLACALCALKCNGSKGVHCELSIGDKFLMDFYTKLGFFPVTPMDEIGEDTLCLGRPI